MTKTLDNEFEKVMKSPYWVDYAIKQGYTIEKPQDIIKVFKDKKRQIEISNTDINLGVQNNDINKDR